MLAGSAAGAAPVGEASQQPSLIEAARKNRERIRAQRARRGVSVLTRDADLGRARGGEGEAATAPSPEGAGPEPEAAGPEPDAAAPAPEAGEVKDRAPPAEPDRAERIAALRERLLDIEASLAAIGASGLPYATRDPNRFRSGFDAARLRAEQEEIREELRELTVSPESPPARGEPGPQPGGAG